ncbi:unnamed protein product [Dicrocoelium dendriticum]|nr:unnamed protein product [Dicrocoelium dendriticum]
MQRTRVGGGGWGGGGGGGGDEGSGGEGGGDGGGGERGGVGPRGARGVGGAGEGRGGTGVGGGGGRGGGGVGRGGEGAGRGGGGGGGGGGVGGVGGGGGGGAGGGAGGGGGGGRGGRGGGGSGGRGGWGGGGGGERGEGGGVGLVVQPVTCYCFSSITMLFKDFLTKAIEAELPGLNRITGAMIELAGIRNLTLRDYQLVGVNWLNGCASLHRGGILADEMGLGKTCQVVSFLSFMLYHKPKTLILVVCPLSVLNNWINELERSFPGVNFLAYWGPQETRADKRSSFDPSCCPILLTTYEICINDRQFMETIDWDLAVVDEGHHLKSSDSLRFEVLSEVCKKVRFILTGTPIQNDLRELYNLLHFVAPSYFPMHMRSAFLEYFEASDAREERDRELSKVIQPFILRRTKHQVALDLPPRLDVLIYHSLTPLQLKIYQSLLTRNADVFTSVVANELGTSTSNLPSYRINNLLMQLRKCVDHPYLFDGVEPEPFELGDHLIDSSGKLTLLDLLLEFLYNPFSKRDDSAPQTSTVHPTGPVHKVLVFSQMTRMLDIIQDYLTLKDYPYERLDGSIRGEDRMLAVQGFSQDRESFVFLLSTRAGGQGLNLVAADTVILMDSDFNPQNDIQATARAHRIGQTKPVRVIRLVGRDTVEEAILSRADAKLKLTTRVLRTKSAPSNTDGLDQSEPDELNAVLKFGLSRLLKNVDLQLGPCDTDLQTLAEKKPSKPDLNFAQILGKTDPSTWHWLPPTQSPDSLEQTDFVHLTDRAFQCDISEADVEAAEMLKKAHQLDVEQARQSSVELEGYRTRAHGPPTDIVALEGHPKTVVKQALSEEALEERRRKRAESAAKRLAAELEKRKAKWDSVGYSSLSVFREEIALEIEARQAYPHVSSGDVGLGFATFPNEEGVLNRDASPHPPAIHYVLGDASEPLTKFGESGPSEETYTRPAIVCLTLDDSGSWPHGGFFGALSQRSTRPKEAYELAGELDDLQLGDCHMVVVTNSLAADSDCSSVRTFDDLIRLQGSVSLQLESVNLCGLLVAQRHTKRSKSSGAPPDLRLDALERSLASLGHACSVLKRCSVHIPRLGHGTRSFEWYSVERLLQKYLVNGSRVSVYVYYHRDRRSSSTSVAVYPPTHSVRPVTEKRTSLGSKSVSPPAVKRPAGIRHLANLFSGKRFYLLSSSTNDSASMESCPRVKDVTLSSDVTHVVVINSETVPLLALPQLPQACCIITPDWVLQSLREKTCLPETKFRFLPP